MPLPQPQRSFSAKSPAHPRPGPPRKQPHDASVRDYLRPDEVDAMMQAARKAGRHRVRDAAIILMLFRHGLRTAELVALRWQQVDLHKAPCGRTLHPSPLDQGPPRGALEVYVPRLMTSPSS